MRKSKLKDLVLLLILLAVIFSGCGGKKEDPAAKYTLVVTVQPQGAGNVMLNPAGNICKVRKCSCIRQQIPIMSLWAGKGNIVVT